MLSSNLGSQIIMAAERNAPKIDWNPSSWLQESASKVAFVLALVLFVMLIASKVSLGRRGRFGSQMGGGTLAAGGVALVFLMDLTLVGTAVNFCLRLVWELADLVGFV